MKTYLPQVRSLAAMALTLASVQLANAQTLWTGAGGNQNWSTPGNWSTGFVPGPSDTLIFTNTGSVALVSNLNNVVDSGFGAPAGIASLQYAQTNAYHTTFLAPGQALTISGGLSVGSESDDGAAALVWATMTGPGATINLTGGNLQAHQGSATAGTHRGALDLSGVDTLTATVGRVVVGVASANNTAQNRNSGAMYLAKTNIITANGSAPALDVGDTASTGNNGTGSALYLGQTNAIFVNGVASARVKATTASIQFYPGFANPVAYFRAADGVSPIPNWTIADGMGNSGGTTTPTATNDFTGGTVDALIDTMTLGKSSTGGTPSGRLSQGILTFGAGTINVNSVTNGWQTLTGTAPDQGIGIINVNGTAKLIINSVLEMGRVAGTPHANSRGELNINGGTVQVDRIVANFGSANNTIRLNSGTLILTNGAGPGIRHLSLTNSTLALPALTADSTVIATNLVIGGSTNKINILSIPVVSGYPAQFALVSYSGSVGGEAFNAGLGTLPASIGTPYAGYLSNNAANQSIDLVLTAGLEPAKALTWNGTPNGNWEAGSGTAANWIFDTTPTNFNQTDFVTFNDTASGSTTVNLTTALLPSGVTVANDAKTYSFTGVGGLSGGMALVKQGSGALLVNNDGVNDFTGGITIEAGTLQVGNNNTSGTLPASGPINNDGMLAIRRTDDVTIANPISGNGSISKNGAGTLVLSAANSFTGAVSITQGTLRPANNAALGTVTGGTTIASGATLDVTAVTANSLNLGTEPIVVSGTGVNGAGAIVNSSVTTAQQNALRVVTLAGDTAFGGEGRWDIRGTGATLSTGSNAFNITKIGPNQVSLVAVNPVDAKLGNINVQQGTFAVQTGTMGLGDPTRTVTVSPGATLNFYNLANPLDKRVELNGDGLTASVDAENGNSTVVGPVTLNGAQILFNIRGTSLTLSNALSGTAGLNKKGAGALTLGGNASHAGGTLLNEGSLFVNGIHSGGVTNVSGTTLGGSGAVNGFVDVQGTLNPDGLAGAGTFTAAAGLWLESSSSPTFDLTATNTASGGVNDRLQVNGNVFVDGAFVTINPVQGRLQPGTYRLANYSGFLFGSFSGASTINQTRYTFGLDALSPGQVNLIVSGSSADLKWASPFDSAWNVFTSPNWSTLPGGSATEFFFDGDSVRLDDSAAGVTNTLTLDAGVAVKPWGITNNSTANSYTIMGAGKISGTAGIEKSGGSTLTILTTNDYTGPVDVLAGTLKVGSSGALGATNSGTTIASGASLDVGATNMAANILNLGFEQVAVSGAGVGGKGAITSSGTNAQQNALRFVAMIGDTTFGGTLASYWLTGNGRWDIRGTGNTDLATNTSAVLSTGGQPYNLTKAGSNQVSLVGVLVDPALADINILGGALSFEHATTMGAPAKTLTVTNGATLMVWQTWQSNLLDKVIVLYGDGINTNVYSSSGDNVIVGPVNLKSGVANSNCVVGTVGATLTFSNNTLSGSAGLIKVGSGRLNLYGTQTYLGDTVVSAGTLGLGASSALSSSPRINVAAGATLDVSGRSDATLNLAGAQILTGNGTVAGSLTAPSGTTVSPGVNGIGALSVTNAVVLAGTTTMDLGTGTNDVFRGAASIQYGGTLNLVFPPGSLAAANTFKLFAAGSYSGAFTITPATPGTGLAWNTTTLATDGTLRLVQTVNTTPTNITSVLTGNQLDLSWPADHTGWRLQGQTNSISVGLQSNWADVPGSVSTNRVIIPVNPANGTVFYRLVYP